MVCDVLLTRSMMTDEWAERARFPAAEGPACERGCCTTAAGLRRPEVKVSKDYTCSYNR